jgi:hypothetical protein
MDGVICLGGVMFLGEVTHRLQHPVLTVLGQHAACSPSRGIAFQNSL